MEANAFSPVVVEPLPEFFCYGGTVDIDRVFIQLNEYGRYDCTRIGSS